MKLPTRKPEKSDAAVDVGSGSSSSGCCRCDSNCCCCFFVYFFLFAAAPYSLNAFQFLQGAGAAFAAILSLFMPKNRSNLLTPTSTSTSMLTSRRDKRAARRNKLMSSTRQCATRLYPDLPGNCFVLVHCSQIKKKF